MKRKLIYLSFALVLVLALTLVPASTAVANTVSSSTMIFHGTLTYEGGGVYTGTLPLADEVTLGIGDGINGFDVYAKEGALPYFTDDRGLVTPATTIVNHDAYPTWDPDVPDWTYYALKLNSDSTWELVYNGETPRDWDTNGAVPMSGTMDWNARYAAETDVGYYFGSYVGSAAVPGDAALNGGGPAAWDMDWSWGSEVVPLQFPGFSVSLSNVSGDEYIVYFTPAVAGTTNLTVDVPDIVAISVDPTSIDFGTLVPGASSGVYDIYVTNVGTHTVSVSAEVSGATLFEENLKLKNYSDSGAWLDPSDYGTVIASLVMDATKTLRTKIAIPGDYTPNNVKTAQLVFTATGI